MIAEDVKWIKRSIEEECYSVSGYVMCPDCSYIEDDQYTCTTCWQQGGSGSLDVEAALHHILEYVTTLEGSL